MAKKKDGTKKRGLWKQDALFKAILAVKEKGLPIHDLCRRYGVPRRTHRLYLCDESNPTLLAEQEQELCSCIFRLCDVGCPLTSKVLQLMFRYCSDNGIPNKSPAVAKRKAQRLNPARAAKLNRIFLRRYITWMKMGADCNFISNLLCLLKRGPCVSV
ncbi:hypothetical protein PR048_005168 [Dryococelus australis]|uniref:HTH psq-type domain-containing protein n=1 Tax=Dryococelus australis TaxID=614101 RepID=A0ABQ9I7F5_9NEOP|nr:hypothetical protein PR048_005168 [Dryococelus australis]